MSDRYQTVLLFGGPGVGKGTQGELLGKIPGFFHCSTGDIFRGLNPNSELGKVFTDYSSRGELVPDSLTVRVWAENVAAHCTLSNYKPEFDLLMLDGIPRTVEQARLIDQHVEVKKIVYLACEDIDAMVARIRARALKSKRRDDADENVIRHRWEVYTKETQPVLDFYDAKLLSKVDAIGTVAEVLVKTLGVLAPVQAAHAASHAP